MIGQNYLSTSPATQVPIQVVLAELLVILPHHHHTQAGEAPSYSLSSCPSNFPKPLQNINNNSYTFLFIPISQSIIMAPLKVGDSLPEGVKFEYVPLSHQPMQVLSPQACLVIASHLQNIANLAFPRYTY